jgi:hypothetical protein
MNQINLLDRVGDWNPQLARELKGRVKPKLVWLSVGLSLLGQFMLWIFFDSKLPIVPENRNDQIYNDYCTGTSKTYRGNLCIFNSFGKLDIDWSAWWFDFAQILSVILLLVLLVGGVYILVNNMAIEERKKTLNFIRLSPQSSQSILLGKILGVPSLIYLAIALVLPLHFWAALQSGATVMVVKYYILVAASCALFYTAALLFASLGGNQAWLASGFAGFMAWPYVWLLVFMLGIQSEYWYNETSWFFISFSQHPVFTQGFVLGNCLLWTYWMWRALNRRFRNPNSTLITKGQSYWITACFELVLLGFFLEGFASDIVAKHYNSLQGNLYGTALLNLGFFFVLAASLFPTRQSLQDWARYKHLTRVDDRNRRKHFSLADELIFGEKSPVVVAIAINLAITALIWMPWFIIGGLHDLDALSALTSSIFAANLIWIYLAIAQLILLSKARKRVIWAASTILALNIIPPIVIGLMLGTVNEVSGLWIFSVFGGSFFALDSAGLTSIFLSLFGQFGLIFWLSSRLAKTLHKVGESHSKALMKSQPVLNR